MRTRHALTILAVDDLARSVAFYGALGWGPAIETPAYVELSLPDGMRLGLYAREAFGRNPGREAAAAPGVDAVTGSELYLYPDDLDAAVEALRSVGAEVLDELSLRDWGDEAIYLRDPDGNVVALARASSPARPSVRIVYCRPCGFMLRAAWLAQELLTTFGEELGEVALVPGDGGVLEVRVGDEVVWSREVEGRFPEARELEQRVRDRIAPGCDLGHSDRERARRL